MFRKFLCFLYMLLVPCLSVIPANAVTNVSSNISSDTTWTPASGPYYIMSTVAVEAGATLTIEPGVVVKFAEGSQLEVLGTLNAAGAEDSEVYFTDERDDAAGGDTNGDGGATVPAPGWWHGIFVQDGGVLMLDHSVVRYAMPVNIYKTGPGEVQISNSVVSDGNYGIMLGDVASGATIRNSAITNNWTGIAGSQLEIIGSDLRGNSIAPVVMPADGAVTIDAATVYDKAIDVVPGTISANASWGNGAGARYYVLGGYPQNLTVAAGATLTLQAGTVVKFAEGSQLEVLGTLNAAGTEGSEVYFTDERDDAAGGDTNGDGGATVPAPGWWHGIFVQDGGVLMLDHSVVRYAMPVNIYKTGPGEVQISNSVVSDGNYGIMLGDVASGATIRNSAITNNWTGILLGGTSTIANIFNNKIFSNHVGVSVSGEAKPLIGGSASKGNDIYGNSEYGVKNDSTVTVNATYNYWGSPSGPYHPATNPAGAGNKVSDFVDYGHYFGVSAMSRSNVCAACPKTTIQAAIDAADAGDVIKVHQGMYHENLIVDTTKELIIKGGYDDTFIDPPAADPSLTRINGDINGDGSGDGSVVSVVNSPAMTIDNFTLMNGSAAVNGGGIAITAANASVGLRNVFIRNNSADEGGGIYLHAADGAAVTLNMVNTVIAGNAAISGGGIAASSSGSGNATLHIMNSTLGDNRVTASGGGLHAVSESTSRTDVTITNSILWGNLTAVEGDDISRSGTGTTIITSFSDIGTEPFASAATNISADPVFVNPALYDYRLNSDSPCINNGSTEGSPSEDFEGQARDDVPDMGADEYQSSTPPLTSLKLLSLDSGEVIDAGMSYDITWAKPDSMGALSYKITYSLDNGLTWLKPFSSDPLVTGNIVDDQMHFRWEAPVQTKNKKNCLVKVLAYSGTGGSGTKLGSVKSAMPFTMQVTGVLSPNGGETLPGGLPVTVRWTTTSHPVATITEARLYYSLDGGVTWKLIGSVPGNPGATSWTVPLLMKKKRNCRVKVDLYSGSAKVGSDKSDASFTIAP